MAMFLGYHREDGRIGVRNLLLVLSLGGLTGRAARRIAAQIDGAVVVVLPYGVGLTGADAIVQARAIDSLVTHPNVGATVVVGDNSPQMKAVVARMEGAGQLHAGFTLDECGHDAITLVERGVRAAARLARAISDLRPRPAPLSALCVGLECGRSDPSSGLVANPLLGLVADQIVAAGGTAILGETMEWIGAEELLAARARRPDVASRIRAAANARQQAASAAGVDLVRSNPGPTNIAAGLSTIEEKSLGAIAKSGASRIEGLIAYGESPAGPGLWLMDAASYAPESMTGFVVAGAQLNLFTTGVGNSYVSLIAPTLKVSANPESAARLREQIDFDASRAFRGNQDLTAAGEALFDELLRVASGGATWGEVLMEGDEVVSRYGVAL
ncbi:MAG: UxaA family hydrolase [Methylobacteriaceae bacterium]|nr:UxaA family hydrolase [Methylobacteriaceae bacterium]